MKPVGGGNAELGIELEMNTYLCSYAVSLAFVNKVVLESCLFSFFLHLLGHFSAVLADWYRCFVTEICPIDSCGQPTNESGEDPVREDPLSKMMLRLRFKWGWCKH